MTTRDYIKKSLSKFDVSTDDVDIIIVDNGLVGESEVNVREAKTAMCKSIGTWLPVVSSVTEGGVSKSWNFDALKLYYSTLCEELGLKDITKPTIKDRSNRW